MGDGHASGPEVAGLRGICGARSDFLLLRFVVRLHPPGYGGALGFPARTPSALVRKKKNIYIRFIKTGYTVI